MTQGMKSIVPTIALIAVLAMAPVAPEAGNTIFLAAGAVGLLLMWPDAAGQLGRPIVWMPLLGLIFVGTAYFLGAGLDGLAGLLYFAPLLAIWPFLSMLRSVEHPRYALLLGLLAFSGAAGAAAMAITEVQATGTTRAGKMVANPIHFADVALLVGFVALVGLTAIKSHWKYVFLLAPAMATVAVVLSGTRGAVVAIVAMVVAAAFAAALVRLVPRRLVLAGLAGLAAIAMIAFFLGANEIAGIRRVLVDISDTLVSGTPTDRSTTVRLQMYLGGFRAFLESPLFGHGPLAFTAVADNLADVPFDGAPHLHNDFVDMAASAGILGVAAYALFLLAPVVEAFRAPRSSSRSSTIVIVVALVAGYFVMGLTNAMFGILTVTTTFAAICVITGFLTSGQDT